MTVDTWRQIRCRSRSSLRPGQFYAPQRPGERVLSLSSDQADNTLLVSGDTSGRLRIWGIGGFGLEMQQQVSRSLGTEQVLVVQPLRRSLSAQNACEPPPLLQSWRVQTGELVRVEVLAIAGRLWVLTASDDGSASLWTKEGDHVGRFGQRASWNIAEPATQRWALHGALDTIFRRVLKFCMNCF